MFIYKSGFELFQIAFDECHKAKMFSTNKKFTTKMGEAVVAIQCSFLDARILYCSATAAWKPEHLAYFERLGLWGNETFKTVDDFILAMKDRHVIWIN
jgi:hypothetical protein